MKLPIKKANNRTRHIVKGLLDNKSPILKLNDVRKSFGKFEALKGISFEIQRGERVGLIGANGAGKTTISEIIAGLAAPTSGTIEYGFEFEDVIQEGIGMQFQQSEYPSGLKVKDMISFALRLRRIKMTSTELNEILGTFQMKDFYNRKARALSGGQRQKLNILMSVLHEPNIIILDELSTGLDIAAKEEIITFADNLLTEKNMSAIVISHHIEEIKRLCSRVIILDHGSVVEMDTVKNIEKKHGSLYELAKKLINDGQDDQTSDIEVDI